MLPIYLVIGLINIFAKTQNYGIKIDDPEMDIRVKRDVFNIDMTSKVHQLFKNSYNDILSREKRQFSFFAPKISNQVTNTPKYSNVPRYNYNNGSRQYLDNRNTGIYNYNGTGINRINQTRNYSLQNTFMPKFNASRPGYNNVYPGYKYNGTEFNKTSLYYGQIPSIPPLYNYQDPTKKNFSGYFEHSFYYPGNRSSGFNNNNAYNYNTTIKPYAPGYLPIPEFNGYKPNNGSKHWYNNFNRTSTAPTPKFRYAKPVLGNSTETTTELQIACVICPGECAEGYHKVSGMCIPDDY